MRSWVAALFGLVFVGLSGCYQDDSDRHRGGCHRGESAPACQQGVAIALGEVASRFGAALPVTVTACFDQDCDQVTVVRSAELTCVGAEGGPPDQLTWCDLAGDGSLSIDIMRVDGQAYEGAEHTAAVSIRDQSGALLYSQARSVAVGPGCGLVGVDATR